MWGRLNEQFSFKSRFKCLPVLFLRAPTRKQKNLEKRKLVFTTFPMQGKSNAQIIYSSEGQRSTQG